MPNSTDMGNHGLIHLYTGEGKGKTTAALGLAVRASGAGMRVIFAQFMKGRETSELEALAKLDNIRVLRSPSDLGWYRRDDEAQKAAFTAVHNALLDEIDAEIAAGRCDLLVLDEITYPYAYGIIDRERVAGLISRKPEGLELVLTGRRPDPLFLEKANYITEMKAVRHPYTCGISARRGIEY